MSRARVAAICLALAACGAAVRRASPALASTPGPPPPAPRPAPAPAPARGLPVARVTLADVGREALALDRTADPDVDVFSSRAAAGSPTPRSRPTGPRGAGSTRSTPDGDATWQIAIAKLDTMVRQIGLPIIGNHRRSRSSAMTSRATPGARPR